MLVLSCGWNGGIRGISRGGGVRFGFGSGGVGWFGLLDCGFRRTGQGFCGGCRRCGFLGFLFVMLGCLRWAYRCFSLGLNRLGRYFDDPF